MRFQRAHGPGVGGGARTAVADPVVEAAVPSPSVVGRSLTGQAVDAAALDPGSPEPAVGAAARGCATALDDGHPAATAGPGSGRRGRGLGVVLMLTSPASNQAGAAIGSMAFGTIGPVGVVAVRQFVTALVLVPWMRPRLRRFRADQWRPILALAAVFSLMNLSLYLAIDRLGLALAVVLEFLGPLAVAIGSSRRRLDIGCALLAAVGVVVLLHPGPSTDAAGIALGIVAATGWACYILLNRTLGRRLPRLEGTAAASVVTAAVWIPIAVVWLSIHTPTVAAMLLATACGLLSSAVPYASDLVALRRIPTHIFATVTSVNPVMAALAGLVLLHQVLGPAEWIGMALIVASNTIVTSTGMRRSR